MPGHEPRQLRETGPRASLGHLGQTEVDAICEHCSQQQWVVFRQFARLQMREVPGEVGPAVDFEQQVRNFQVRKQAVGIPDQPVGCGWNRIDQWGHRKAALSQLGVGQLPRSRQGVGQRERLAQDGEPIVKIRPPIGRHGKTQPTIRRLLLDVVRRQKIVLEVPVLPAANYPDVAGSERVLELGHGAEFVVPTINIPLGEHNPSPASPDKIDRCVIGTRRTPAAFISRNVSTASSRGSTAGAARNVNVSRNVGP